MRMDQDVLDLLVDGPTSVGALWGGLVRHCGYSQDLRVREVLRVLMEMKQDGEVRVGWMNREGELEEPSDEEIDEVAVEYQSWLPGASFEDLAIDEIGVWVEITPRGRERWQRDNPPDPQEEGAHWMLDDFPDLRTLSVLAMTREAAEEGLRQWLLIRPDIRPVDASRYVEAPTSFQFRDGTLVLGGVKLVVSYYRTGEGRAAS